MQSRRTSAHTLALAAATLLVLGGCPAPQQQTAAAPEAPSVGRFAVQRMALKRDSVLIRTDTATGQAWHMRLLGAGPWVAYNESKYGVPSPDGTQSGRYEIWPEVQRRGAPTLVRVDTVTGRVWRVGSTGVGSWVLVAESGDGGSEPDAAAAPEEADPDEWGDGAP